MQLRGDPAGDVVVQESPYRARDQGANAGLDLVGVGAAARCVALRTAGPLPSSFQVDLRDGDDRSLRATVTDGRVLVEDTTDADDLPKPVAGVAAHLEPDGLVLSLPQAVKAPLAVALGVERNDLTYSDDATTPRATSRRCARPTSRAARPPRSHAALEALDHVVDRQRRDGGRGHRLHLDAGARGDAPRWR